MPIRARLYDFRTSRGPNAVGVCTGDIADVAAYANSAQTRLVLAKEAGDEGWWGTWAEMAFTVSRTSPYLTTPRGVARLEAVTVCDHPVPVQNQFYEYLDFGNGRLPKQRRHCGHHLLEVLSRNVVPVFVDPPTQPFFIQVFAGDPADIQAAKRVLVQGSDQNGVTVRTQDAGVQVTGEYVTLDTPFEQATFQYSAITGFQKDVTLGPVQIFAVDVTTGVSTLILTMEPGEQVSAYRRYFFNALPRDCCAGTSPVANVTVTAIAKLELVPAVVDQDYLLIQNVEALIEEAQSIRYSMMDVPTAKQMSRDRHNAAIGLLNGELSHYLGTDRPAVSFKPFGSADFNRVTRGFI